MLEFIKRGQVWKWTAMGKHPAAPDFFRLGSSGPLADGFYNWARDGYGLLDPTRAGQKLHFWRFWSRGSGKEELVCGLLRDSTDRLGRPHPLLITGVGVMNGWEAFWDLLPLACEGLWHQMESISIRSFSDLRQFEMELENIRTPRPDWQNLTAEYGRAKSKLNEYLGKTEFEASDLNARGDLLAGVDQNGLEDYSAVYCIRHSLLKNRFGYDPKTVFMGGNPSEAFLAVFGRPLAAEDFVRLWSV